MHTLAWGKLVSAAFRLKIAAIAVFLGIDASWLMACIAFESAASFRSDIRNAAGSGAIGLIQFMPQTAGVLGTTVAALGAMTPEDQLTFVGTYFSPFRGRLRNIGDCYMAILWPEGVGKDDDHVLFDKADPHHPAYYVQNRGLDWNADGKITRGEAIKRVLDTLQRGLLPQYAYTGA